MGARPQVTSINEARNARLNNKRPIVESEAERRGKLTSDTPGEFHFDDPFDAVNYVAAQVRLSDRKYSQLAAGNMASSTVSNMASGKTHYPRFSTMSGLLGALGKELVIRGRGGR